MTVQWIKGFGSFKKDTVTNLSGYQASIFINKGYCKEVVETEKPSKPTKPAKVKPPKKK